MQIEEPWHSYLDELDQKLESPITLICIGGFVVSMYLGTHRETADLDYLAVTPSSAIGLLETIAGRGSELHRKFKLYLQFVSPAIACPPYEYESRLVDGFPGQWQHLRLMMLERHDIMLLKLLSDRDVDREDFLAIAGEESFDLDLFRARFEDELADNITGRPETHRITLNDWIEMAKEERARRHHL